jgi:hypothetical protein
VYRGVAIGRLCAVDGVRWAQLDLDRVQQERKSGALQHAFILKAIECYAGGRIQAGAKTFDSPM